MASKRMFNIKIIDSDAFLDMPLSTQALYFHLNMRADDDGFVGNPKRIQRLVGASEDDLKLLIAKRFLLVFEDGVIAIKHWRMHNTIRNDRYTRTAYIEELKQLKIKDNKAYTLSNDEIVEWQPNGNQMATVGMTNKEEMATSGMTIGKQNASTGLGLDIGLDIGLGLDKDIDNAQSDKITHEPTPTEPSVITITLNDKSEYPIYQSMVDEWNELYPNVDVLQELRKMKGWSNANPAKRKTKKGIQRFINAWLSREQDKPSYNKKTAPVINNSTDDGFAF